MIVEQLPKTKRKITTGIYGMRLTAKTTKIKEATFVETNQL